MAKVNNYQKSHDVADKYEEQLALFYDRVLDVQDISYVRDKENQMKGKDVKVQTNKGLFYVDEKVRIDPWGDIALEEFSNVETGREGWLNEESKCDYLCYAVVPLNVIYWVPFKELVQTFHKRKEMWEWAYGAKFPLNEGYKSKIIPVQGIVIHEALVQDHDHLKDWPYEGGMLHRWNFMKEDE